ncbi:pyocin knob domain-containing protein [Bacillus safensis]|uniref:pyocin knob domain-containing protein n=1 Tax=Bacillus safensis TaxID=561879 RepID=UPI00228214C4|nr:pyocin knob domain-containing protein [Bacillus safensis]MCY7494779.1 pyocin knob domain-containing protein [Bacillus safensis]MED4993264.1 pyocin knob domain-containing protein [Bacillus safensis]
MDIKTPRSFETSDKAHADIFNAMLKILIHNDTGISEQLTNHIEDSRQHSSEVEKKKWNESQLYKITGDDGVQLINIPVGSKIFDAIKDKGTCTFYAPSGIEDSPSQFAIRGIQTVGQNNIGTGFAIDTSGNAYYFYYNSSHLSITWTQIPTAVEKDKWNNGQLFKLTQNNGRPIYKGVSETTDYNEMTETGMYLIYNAGLNGPKEIKRAFMIVINYGNTLLQAIYDAVNGLNFFCRIRKNDYTWTEWERQLTSTDLNAIQSFPITDSNGQGKVYISNTDDFHEVLPKYRGLVHFVSANAPTNGPGTALRGIWTCNSTSTYGQAIGFDNLNRTWRKTIANGVWSKWERLLTSAEQIEWKSPTTIINGWKQYGTQKVQFYKNAFGEVELMGSITGGTIGFEVPVFTLPSGYRPIQGMHFIGVASSIGAGSTPQTHRTHIDTDGNVYIQSVSNSTNPNEFITFGFKFMAAQEG